MLPDPTPQKACQNRFRRELMEWTRACAQLFLPVRTAGLAVVGCVAQFRDAADGCLIPTSLPIGESWRTVELRNNRFKTVKQGQKHVVLLK